MRSREGFTLLETIVAASIMMILAAVAAPRLGALAGRVEESQAQRIADAGNTALRMDFSRQIVEGGYKSPFPKSNKEGQKLKKKSVEALEALLESGFSYPPGFQWMLVEQATSTQPPVIGYQ